MHDLEANKQLVREFFFRRNEGRIDDAFALMSPDFTWWIGKGQSAVGSTMTATELASTDKRFLRLFSEPFVMTLGSVTAEADRVVVEAEGYGRLKDGSIYNNSYSHHFVIKDGQITSWREHCNTALFSEIVVARMQAS